MPDTQYENLLAIKQQNDNAYKKFMDFRQQSSQAPIVIELSKELQDIDNAYKAFSDNVTQICKLYEEKEKTNQVSQEFFNYTQQTKNLYNQKEHMLQILKNFNNELKAMRLYKGREHVHEAFGAIIEHMQDSHDNQKNSELKVSDFCNLLKEISVVNEQMVQSLSKENMKQLILSSKNLTKSYADFAHKSEVIIIDLNKHSPSKAKNTDNATAIKSIKEYLSAAIELIIRLYNAVKAFVGNVSQKTNKAMATSFGSFKESINNIKVPTKSGSDSKNKPQGTAV